MKKHISEVELWRQGFTPDEEYQRDEPPYHRDEFCLLCGYFMEGDRLYMEIHGSDGALGRVKDIDSSQPYVCMECVGHFEVRPKMRSFTVYRLTAQHTPCRRTA